MCMSRSVIDRYQNPGGWIEFWVGLIVFTLFFCWFGNVIYKHEQVKQQDLEFRLKLEAKSKAQ